MKNLNVRMIKGQQCRSPSVAFDAIESEEQEKWLCNHRYLRGASNKQKLTCWTEKIKKTANPDLTMFVGDAFMLMMLSSSRKVQRRNRNRCLNNHETGCRYKRRSGIINFIYYEETYLVYGNRARLWWSGSFRFKMDSTKTFWIRTVF